MTHLKPSHEQLVQEAPSSGRYRTVDEFLDEALSAWKNSESQRFDLQKIARRGGQHPRTTQGCDAWRIENRRLGG